MASLAVVARTRPHGLEYLIKDVGPAQWVANADAAARYQSLREATRAALRLPSGLRAFALPADS